MVIEKAPLVSEYETSEKYIKAMKEYLSQEYVRERSDSGDLKKTSYGFIDTCEGINEIAKETVDGAYDFAMMIFNKQQRDKV